MNIGKIIPAIVSEGQETAQKIANKTPNTSEPQGSSKLTQALDTLDGINRAAIVTKKPLTSDEKKTKLIEKGLNKSYAQLLSKLDDTNYKRILTLLDKGVDPYTARSIIIAGDKAYERYMPLLGKIDKEIAARIALLDDECYERFSRFFNNGYDSYTALRFSKLSEEQCKRIPFLTENKICELCIPTFAKLDDESYKKAQEIIKIEKEVTAKHYEKTGNILYYNDSNISEFSKLQGKEFERAIEMLKLGIQDNIVKECVTLDDAKYGTFLSLLSKGIEDSCAKTIIGFNETQSKKAQELVELGIKRSNYIYEISEYDDARFKKAIELIKKGATEHLVQDISAFDDRQYQQTLILLDKKITSYYIKDVAQLSELQFQRALELKSKGTYDCYLIELATCSDEQYKKALFMLQKGVYQGSILDYIKLQNEEYERLLKLLDNGIEASRATKVCRSASQTDKLIDELRSKPNAMRDLLNSEDYSAKLKIATQGKYRQQIMQMLDNETITYAAKKSLLESGLNEEDFFAAVKKLSKSTFKKGLDMPNLYLSDIDIKYTTKVNGKYPQLSGEELEGQQKEMMSIFSCQLKEILRAAKYLDADTINQMMDKRTESFADALIELNKLNDENYSLLGNLIKCKYSETGKDLTARDKIQLCQLIQTYQESKIDTSSLVNMTQNGKIDIPTIKEKIKSKIIEDVGITQEQLAHIPSEKTKLNDEYFHLILKNQDADKIPSQEEIMENIAMLRNAPKEIRLEIVAQSEDTPDKIPTDKLKKVAWEKTQKLISMYKDIENYTDEEIIQATIEQAVAQQKCKKQANQLYTVVRESILGNFHKFISDTSNIYGQANAKTKEAFISSGLDYEKWLKPDIEDVPLEVAGKKMTIKMWDRNPQEDLFMGNKTTCCTAIGAGCNADSTPIYLTNTAFNVVEIYDEKGNVIGMSRIFMAKDQEEPALIIDNIELNKTYIKGMSQDKLKEIRDGIFGYMKRFASQVTKKEDSPIYFSTNFANVPKEDLAKKTSKINLVGEISSDFVYINSKSDLIELEKLSKKPINWYVVR